MTKTTTTTTTMMMMTMTTTMIMIKRTTIMPLHQTHCFSAGIGRTGTYLALDILLERAEKEAVLDVFTCVWKLRQQRINMVQTLVSSLNHRKYVTLF
jgi:protein tyrosine phosphatase